MTTGFMQRFKGKIMAASLWINKNSLFDATSGVGGTLQGVVRIPLAVTATANTDIVAALPPGATFLSAAVYTTTAFTAVTDCTIQIGNAAAGAQYVAAVSVKAVAVVQLTLVNAAAAALSSMPALTTGSNVFVRLVQTGGATAVGAGILEIEYAL